VAALAVRSTLERSAGGLLARAEPTSGLASLLLATAREWRAEERGEDLRLELERDRLAASSTAALDATESIRARLESDATTVQMLGESITASAACEEAVDGTVAECREVLGDVRELQVRLGRVLRAVTR